MDANGLKSIEYMTAEDLVMPSESWRKDFNLPNFGVMLDNASLFGADLSSSDTAAAMKAAFIAFPMAALQQTVSQEGQGQIQD